MAKSESDKQGADSPSRLIDQRIEELGDWRGEMLARIRTLIKEVDPDVVEEWKWRGVPVWYHAGMICTGETYKSAVKVTLPKAHHSTTLQDSSTPASRAIRDGRSISTRAKPSTKRRSRHSFTPRLP